MIGRGLGWVVDHHDARDRGIGELYGRADAPVLPAGMGMSVSLLQYRPGHILQGPTQSCVGFAFSRAVYLNLAARGIAMHAEHPAPLFTYYNGRRAEYAGMDPADIPPLADTGSRPRLVMQASRSHGYCKASDYPWSPELVNRRPPLRCYRLAVDQSDLAFYRISDTGSARVEAVVRALRRGAGVLFGTRVDEAFLMHKGSEPVSQVGSQTVGRHMMTVLEHRGGAVTVDNWWSDWGFDDGIGRIRDDLFGSSEIDDVYAIHAASPYSG